MMHALLQKLKAYTETRKQRQNLVWGVGLAMLAMSVGLVNWKILLIIGLVAGAFAAVMFVMVGLQKWVERGKP